MGSVTPATTCALVTMRSGATTKPLPERVEPHWKALPVAHDGCRGAQESITNARRHARRATQVTVAVTGEADQVRLTIADDGSAAGVRAPAGYGLVGMRERASLLGGTFHAGPAAERGWRVEAVLPRTGTPR